MLKVIMGIGIPGSGKSTTLKNFANKNNYAYICPDDIRQHLTGDAKDQSKNPEVWQQAYDLVADNLKQGKSVVFDATFANLNQRKQFINFSKQNGAQKIQGVYLDIPLEIAKQRNQQRERVVPEHVQERMSRDLQDNPPKIADGFDAIFTLNEYQKLIDAEKISPFSPEGLTKKSFN